MKSWLGTSTAKVRAGLIAGLLLASIVGIPWGLPGWLVLGAASLPWIVTLSRTLPLTLATTLVLSGELVAMLAVMWAGPALGFDALLVMVILAFAWGALGLVTASRSGAFDRKGPARVTVAQWAGAGLGGAVWIATMIAARFYPGAASVAWAMVGDSANNVIFAREVIDRGGLEFGARSNPVPLPSVVAALGMWSGRGGVAASDLTRHDVWSFSTTWAGVIVVTCVVLGLVVGAIARTMTSSPTVVAVAASGGSMFALTWFVTGYPIDYGFFNAHITFVLLGAVWLAYVSLDVAPSRVIATLALLITATLAVWSPLALVPVALAGVGTLRHLRSLLGLRGREALALLASIAQLLAYLVFVSYPAYTAQSESLSAPGGAYTFRNSMVPSLACVAVVLAVVAFWRRPLAIPFGVVAASGAALAGLGFLLSSSESTNGLWTYYPLKFAWFTGVMLTVLVAALALAGVARFAFRRWLLWPGITIVAVSTLGFALWAPTSGVGYQPINPVKKVLAGNIFGEGDEWAERIFELSNLEDGHVLWDSAQPEAEGSINFWLLQIWSDSMSENREVKYFAYGLYEHGKVESLCSLLEAMDAPVTIHTARQDLEQELEATCPQRDFTVLVETAP